MRSANWFRKVKSEKAEDAKPDLQPAAASSPEPAPVVAEAVSAESPAAAPPVKPPAGGQRAARLVEVGRLNSSKLKARIMGAAGKAEPWGKPAAAAAAVLAVGALGYAGGLTAGHRGSADAVAASRWTEAAATIRESREETARLASELKFVRIAVDGMKGRGDTAGKQAQLSERVDRYTTETAAKIGKLAEQLDRMEKTQRDPARIAALVERLERIETKVQSASLGAPASTPTPPPKPVAAAHGAAPADVTQTGSLPDPRPPAKPVEADVRKVQIDGYVLRDIDDGLALIEGKNGRFFEVERGGTLPGIGKVESIERRGRHWVVITPKGYIGER